jgi:hypothetical protein
LTFERSVELASFCGAARPTSEIYGRRKLWWFVVCKVDTCAHRVGHLEYV